MRIKSRPGASASALPVTAGLAPRADVFRNSTAATGTPGGRAPEP